MEFLCKCENPACERYGKAVEDRGSGPFSRGYSPPKGWLVLQVIGTTKTFLTCSTTCLAGICRSLEEEQIIMAGETKWTAQTRRGS